jgi:hypothetical protein
VSRVQSGAATEFEQIRATTTIVFIMARHPRCRCNAVRPG